MPTIYLGDAVPPPAEPSTRPRQSISEDIGNLSISTSTATYFTAISQPIPRNMQPPPSSNRAFGPGRLGWPGGGLRNLHTPGTVVSSRPGEYRFLKVPVGRGVGSRHINGIGGNHVASPPLIAGDWSRRNSLALVTEGVGSLNKKVATAAGFGGDSTRYVIEVGDGEGEGECFVGVEVMLSPNTQPSVIQQNLKIAHYLTLNIVYETEKKNVLGLGQRRLATIEIPVFVVHGAPHLEGITA
ncbi:hypothetical protein HDU96_005137 [Phlyctochytrium bullatum]|nr:hypothetical protein HDU96_005137 [Phlyctochytrium bullatum]